MSSTELGAQDAEDAQDLWFQRSIPTACCCSHSQIILNKRPSMIRRSWVCQCGNWLLDQVTRRSWAPFWVHTPPNVSQREQLAARTYHGLRGRVLGPWMPSLLAKLRVLCRSDALLPFLPQIKSSPKSLTDLIAQGVMISVEIIIWVQLEDMPITL